MKRRIILITLLVAVLGGFAWFVLRPREPVYEGKRLSYWLEAYYGTYTNNLPVEVRAKMRAGIEDAVRHIGTNAIPTLLHLLRAKDSPLRIKLDALIKKQHRFTSPFVPAGDKNTEAVLGFQILGAEAKSATPGLIEIFKQNISGMSRTSAASSLVHVHSDLAVVVPLFIESLNDTNQPPNATVVHLLGYLHAEPELVVPVLVKCLKDTNRVVRLTAIRGIGEFGPEARMAIPAVLAEATNSSSLLHYDALQVLGQIHAEPETVLPVLIQSLSDPNPNARSSAAQGLGAFGPGAKTAVPSLIGLFRDPDNLAKNSALKAVAIIDPQNQDLLLALAKGVNDNNYLIKLTSVALLGEMGPSARAAVPDLLKALQNKNNDGAFQAKVAAVLKKIDPEAAAKAGVK